MRSASDAQVQSRLQAVNRRACATQTEYRLRSGFRPNARGHHGHGVLHPFSPTRDLVGDEAGLHGWAGRRVGRGAHVLYGGPVTHNGGGAVSITGGQKRGRKVHGSMHVSAPIAGEKPGGRRGVLVFEGGGGHRSLPAGVGSRPSIPASLPAVVRLNDPLVPSGLDQAQFPVFFPRNVERDLLGYENRRSPGLSSLRIRPA